MLLVAGVKVVAFATALAFTREYRRFPDSVTLGAMVAAWAFWSAFAVLFVYGLVDPANFNAVAFGSK